MGFLALSFSGFNWEEPAPGGRPGREERCALLDCYTRTLLKRKEKE